MCKHYIKITIEEGDGGTGGSHSVTYYDEEDSRATIEDVLAEVLEEAKELELASWVNIFRKTDAKERKKYLEKWIELNNKDGSELKKTISKMTDKAKNRFIERVLKRDSAFGALSALLDGIEL